LCENCVVSSHMSRHQLVVCDVTMFIIVVCNYGYVAGRPFCFAEVACLLFLVALSNLEDCLADRYQALPYLQCDPDL